MSEKGVKKYVKQSKVMEEVADALLVIMRYFEKKAKPHTISMVISCERCHRGARFTFSSRFWYILSSCVNKHRDYGNIDEVLLRRLYDSASMLLDKVDYTWHQDRLICPECSEAYMAILHKSDDDLDKAVRDFWDGGKTGIKS